MPDWRGCRRSCSPPSGSTSGARSCSRSLLRGGPWRPRDRRDLLGVLVAATFLVWLSGGLRFLGQRSTTSAAAAVVFAVVPVVTPLLARLALPGERLTPTGTVGLVVGFAGVAVVVAPARLADPASGGQVLVAGAALSVATGSVLLRRVDPRLGVLPLTAWAMVAGAVAHHLTGLAAGEPGPLAVAWTARSAAAVAVVGVGSTALAFPAYFALIARLGPTRANLVSYAVPVVAAVTGAVVLGESLAARTVVGFLVVAAGFALVASRSLADGLAPRLPFRP